MAKSIACSTPSSRTESILREAVPITFAPRHLASCTATPSVPRMRMAVAAWPSDMREAIHKAAEMGKLNAIGLTGHPTSAMDKGPE